MSEEVSYKLFEQPSQNIAPDIYEPYPHQLAEISKGIDNQKSNLSWVILNNRYVLVFILQEPCVVDLVALYQYWIREQLGQASLPLASRPLLVPIRYSLPPKLQDNASKLQHWLMLLGINLEWVGEHEAFIHSIPLCLPYLNLRLFLNSIADCEVVQQHQLLELLNQSQTFDLHHLNIEEKVELNELLLRLYKEKNRHTGLLKELTNEECRKLLHA